MKKLLFYENKLYREDIEYVATLNLPWGKFNNKTLVMSGASGLLGSFFCDVIVYRNTHYNMNTKIVALGRSENGWSERFSYYANRSDFQFVKQDVNDIIPADICEDVDYVLHLASHTHPLAYSTDPIGTITANIIGTNNLLKFSHEKHCERFVFASSNEIYGENRGDVELFDEKYLGYIDCNTLRAGYPESKRCGEALCQAYKSQKGMDVVIPRFTRTFGPTLKKDDSKALSQFLGRAIHNENIVLKSRGDQYFSYTYVADAIAGLLFVILLGENGVAYNIADASGDIRLKDLAGLCASESKVKVIFELPDEIESRGYSTATKARLDGNKIRSIGWKPNYSIKDGIIRTISIMKDQNLRVT